jgi:hypothetical protein
VVLHRTRRVFVDGFPPRKRSPKFRIRSGRE